MWTSFLKLCQRQFARIQDALGTQRLFLSTNELNINEKSLLQNLPVGFLESEAFLSERRSSSFIHQTLERPAQCIINAYLDTTGQETPLYFDGLSAGWKMRHRTDGSSANSENSDGETENVIRQPRPRKIMPDCLVLRMQMLSLEGGGGDLTAPSFSHEEADEGGREAYTRVISRVIVGEHKAIY